MRVPCSWPASFEFACHDASCAPPPTGTGGSRPTGIGGGEKVWWRLNGGSSGITTAAYHLTGKSSESGGKDETTIAQHMIMSINSQPIEATRLFSGHTTIVPHVGEVVDIPLMGTTPTRGLADYYAGVEHESGIKHPLDRKLTGVMKSLAEVIYPGQSARQIFDGASPDMRDLIGKTSGRTTTSRTLDNSEQSVVYEFQSSRSSSIVHGKERVVSGRFRVVSVESKPIRGDWRYNYSTKDFVQRMFTEVKLAYEGPLQIS